MEKHDEAIELLEIENLIYNNYKVMNWSMKINNYSLITVTLQLKVKL